MGGENQIGLAVTDNSTAQLADTDTRPLLSSWLVAKQPKIETVSNQQNKLLIFSLKLNQERVKPVQNLVFQITFF